jgi:hypothetical protein
MTTAEQLRATLEQSIIMDELPPETVGRFFGIRSSCALDFFAAWKEIFDYHELSIADFHQMLESGTVASRFSTMLPKLAERGNPYVKKLLKIPPTVMERMFADLPPLQPSLVDDKALQARRFEFMDMVTSLKVDGQVFQSTEAEVQEAGLTLRKMATAHSDLAEAKEALKALEAWELKDEQYFS